MAPVTDMFCPWIPGLSHLMILICWKMIFPVQYQEQLQSIHRLHPNLLLPRQLMGFRHRWTVCHNTTKVKISLFYGPKRTSFDLKWRQIYTKTCGLTPAAYSIPFFLKSQYSWIVGIRPVSHIFSPIYSEYTFMLNLSPVGAYFGFSFSISRWIEDS